MLASILCRIPHDTMVLQRKSRGHLIHVSNLINEEDRHLVEHNSDGEVIREARTDSDLS